MLTKLLGRDNINKLAHAGDRGGRALNLENDTEQEKRKQETVIPNEFASCQETGRDKRIKRKSLILAQDERWRRA